MGSVRGETAEDDRMRRWESAIDQAVREAQARGEFDDLPGHGKPLRLDEDRLAGDRAMGFRVLKNAGVLPDWLELEKEIGAEAEALDALLERTARFLRDEGGQAAAVENAGETTVGRRTGGGRRGWRPFGRRRREAATPENAPRFSAGALEVERRRARRAYLDGAARLDKLVVRYNSALPDELRWRQRVRTTPEQSAAAFDAACPPAGAGDEGRVSRAGG